MSKLTQILWGAIIYLCGKSYGAASDEFESGADT